MFPGSEDERELVSLLLPQPGQLFRERLIVLNGHVQEDGSGLATVPIPVLLTITHQVTVPSRHGQHLLPLDVHLVPVLAGLRPDVDVLGTGS